MNKKGFSLTEILVSIGLLAIVGSIVLLAMALIESKLIHRHLREGSGWFSLL